MIVHLVLPGVAESSLAVGVDLVATAARLIGAGLARGPRRAAAVAQRVVSLDGRPPRSSNDRPVAVDGHLGRAPLGPGDVLVVPGLAACATEPTVAAFLASARGQAAIAAVRAAAATRATVAASCSATFLLAAAGLLDERDATTTWWLLPAFARRYPRVRVDADRMVVGDGRVLTAGAAFAHADLMLAVIARVAGPSVADLTARYLVLDDRPSQARYMVLAHARSADPMLRKVEAYAGAHLDRQLSLAELARAGATSTRTLARRLETNLGLSPRAFVQRLRVAHAAHLLETTALPIDAVAQRVGYRDPAAFRRLIRRHLGASPRACRRARVA